MTYPRPHGRGSPHSIFLHFFGQRFTGAFATAAESVDVTAAFALSTDSEHPRLVPLANRAENGNDPLAIALFAFLSDHAPLPGAGRPQVATCGRCNFS